MENQRIRLSKKLLQNSLIQLLQQRSINKISVSDICGGAQINRSTFYRYYGSQYDLMNDIEEEILKHIEAYLYTDDLPDNISKMTRMLYFFNEHLEECRVLLNNNVDPEFPEKLMNLPVIRQLMEHTLGDCYSEQEAEYLYSLVIHGGFEVVRKWMNKEQRESPETIACFMEETIQRLVGSG